MNIFLGVVLVLVLFELTNSQVILTNSGSTSRAKRIILKNPQQATGNIAYTIQATNNYVRQLRINLNLLYLQGPTVPEAPGGRYPYPYCQYDKLTIDGIDFDLCGININQHVYVTVNQTRTVNIRFRIDRASMPSGVFPLPALWDIEVIQLETPNGSPRLIDNFNAPLLRTSFNDAFWIAPNGCLQYYPYDSGVIKSFNHDGNGPYLGNLDYAMCFRRQEGQTTLRLQFDSLEMSSVNDEEPATPPDPTLPPADPADDYNMNCYPEALSDYEDYIFIPEGETTDGKRVVHVCGTTAAGKTIEARVPGSFQIYFHSNDFYDTEKKNEKGFGLRYSIV